MNSFTELAAWQSARELRNSIRKLVNAFPAEEKFRLTDQIIRSSRSVTTNIAEGFGRFNHQDNIRFCRLSRGSLYETIDHLILALDEKYIDETVFNIHQSMFDNCLKILNGYIAYLKRAKEEKAKNGNNLTTRQPNNPITNSTPQQPNSITT